MYINMLYLNIVDSKYEEIILFRNYTEFKLFKGITEI
jgi:hypothetical protein